MRPPFSLEAVGVQLTLQQALQLGDDRAEQQIDHGDLAVDGCLPDKSGFFILG